MINFHENLSGANSGSRIWVEEESMGKKHPNIVNLDEVEVRQVTKGKRFGFSGKRLGAAGGGKQLGCSWFEIEPGRKAFPHHFHCANEEALFILEGEGQLRLGESVVSVEKGDYVAMPAGPQGAHSLTNTGKQPLRYLCFSTLISTEVVVYPDSKKIAAVGSENVAKGMLGSDAWVRQTIREQPSVDYYEGEEID
jgi:uncharacterized cupin superfamily protein